MSTPSKFFKQTHSKEPVGEQSNITQHNESVNGASDTTAQDKSNNTNDNCDKKSESTSTSTYTVDVAVTEHKTAVHTNDKQQIGDIEVCDGTVDSISPFDTFSRNHIAQLEVNMFDLIGHQDKNTGECMFVCGMYRYDVSSINTSWSLLCCSSLLSSWNMVKAETSYIQDCFEIISLQWKLRMEGD